MKGVEIVISALLALLLGASCGAGPPVVHPAARATTTPSPSIAALQLSTRTSTLSPSPVPPATDTPLPPLALDYYQLNIELITTSDWAQVEFLNADAILTTRVVSITGSPEGATASSSGIALWRPVAALASEPTASIAVDIAVSPAITSQPFVVRSTHGAIGGSGTRLSYVADDSFTLLAEINHYWVDPDNPDTSAASYTLDLSSLNAVAPIHAAILRSAPPKMLWAVFYPWIGWDLDAPCTDRPVVGYDNDDPDVLAAHIRDAQRAGIDGFLVSWFNDPVTNRQLSMLLDAAQESGFKIAIYLETLVNDRLNPDIENWIAYALQTFGHHSAYLRLDGRPLVFAYASDVAPLDTWREIFGHLSDRGLPGSYFAMSYDTTNLDVFDGLHQYAVFGHPDLGATYQSIARNVRSVRYSSLLGDSRHQGLWAATVHPGFDNCPYAPTSPFVVGRGEGEYYRSTWLAAISANPDWIIITSWNEFGENTHIAPSIRYGDQYLRMTAELAHLWRRSQPEGQ